MDYLHLFLDSFILLFEIVGAIMIIYGLEFIIAADLLATIIAPSIEDVMLLGAIVAIRTVLSYFLSKETQEYPLEDN
jgi:uncharacterized membrane protein